MKLDRTSQKGERHACVADDDTDCLFGSWCLSSYLSHSQ